MKKNPCPHDPQYRIENESVGGSGCPLCARDQAQRTQLGEILRTPANHPDPRLTFTGSHAEEIRHQFSGLEQGASRSNQK